MLFRSNPEVYFIAVEKESPYGISVHKMTDDVLEKGKSQFRTTILEMLEWIGDGMRPVGYEFRRVNGIYDVELPKWMTYGD